jgi:hypothetical protein
MASTSSGSFCSLCFMCTGEVERKVWMRGRRAWRTASPARSMSFMPARARPVTTAFFTRLATATTASKSPMEAMGKPASMMSTPISSRRSATCSFSSSVMVAPGHCSPSRSVVSKMKTRSLDEALVEVVMVSVLAAGRGGCCASLRRPWSFRLRLVIP